MTETAVSPDRPVQLMGIQRSPAAYAIRDFLQRSDVPFRWVELTTDEEAREKAKVANLRDERLPVCVFPDGTRLERPTIRQIIEKLGWFMILRAPSMIWRFLAVGRRGSVRQFMGLRRV